MPAPPIDGSAPRSELQELQLKSQQVTDEVGLQTDDYFIINLLLFILWFERYFKLIT